MTMFLEDFHLRVCSGIVVLPYSVGALSRSFGSIRWAFANDEVDKSIERSFADNAISRAGTCTSCRIADKNRKSGRN